MSSRPVKKLYNMEIDEISLVDRAANQHSLVSFAKNDSVGDDLEVDMPEGYEGDDVEEVDVEDLEYGDVVVDEEGNEYVFLPDSDEGAEDGFGKALGVGGFARTPLGMAALAGGKSLDFLRRNKGPLAAGAGAGLIGGSLSKSYDIREELSKALTDADRDEMIAKALEEAAYEAEVAKAEAAYAIEQAAYERELRLTDEFVSKAADYNLPVAPEVLGPILKSLAETLDPQSLDILDQIFTATGDALYDEVGYVGESSNSSVLDYVDAATDELVGKADVTREIAMTAMFEANPEAYDAYLNETNGRY